MTTKLYQKLSYLKKTKELIQEALQDKGAIFNSGDSFRSFKDKILNLPQRPLRTFIPSFLEPISNKNIIVYDIGKDFSDNERGTLFGSFESRFYSNGSAISFMRGNLFIATNGTSSSNVWSVYQVGEKEGKPFLSPYYFQKENLHLGKFAFNPVDENVLSTGWFKKEDDAYPSGALSYPTGGSYTDFSAGNQIFDSSGEYLLQSYVDSKKDIDVLRLKKNEAEDSYTYEFVTTLTAETFNNACYLEPADYRAKNTFSASGKYIYKIHKPTVEGEVETFTYFNIFDKMDVLKSGYLICHGKNWLVFRASTSSNAVFSFIKATPIDAELALLDDGFYDNPDNYTYELIHQETAVSISTDCLFRHHKNGYIAHKNMALSTYFKALKDKIDDINDFIFNFNSQNLQSAKGTFLNEDVFIATSFVEGSNTTTRDIPTLYFKNLEAELPRFKKENVFFKYPFCYYSEYGYGYYPSVSTPCHYYLLNGSFTSTNYTTYQPPFDIYFKNGIGVMKQDGIYLEYSPLLVDSKRIPIGSGMSSIIDENHIGYLGANYIVRFGDNLALTYFSCQNMSFKKDSQIVMKYQGKVLIFDFQSQVGEDIDGSLYEVLFDEENLTFEAHLIGAIKGSFSTNQTGLLKRVKQKNFFITTNKVYGLYTGAEDGILRFVEKDFPAEITSLLKEASIYKTQTLYDGTISFILSDGRTLIADVIFDEQTGTASLKENTKVQVLEALQPHLGVRYRFLSPFKKYVITYDPNKLVYQVEYFKKVLPTEQLSYIPLSDNCMYNSALDTLNKVPSDSIKYNHFGAEDYACHLKENTKVNYQTTNYSVFLTGNQALSEEGYLLSEVEWRPLEI